MLERIFRKHGELVDMGSLILETVSAPDLVLEGHAGEVLALKHHDQTPLGPKDMVAIYREDKRLIITAFLISDPSGLLRICFRDAKTALPVTDTASMAWNTGVVS